VLVRALGHAIFRGDARADYFDGERTGEEIETKR